MCWLGALLALVLLVGTGGATSLTLSQVPDGWRRRPITLQIVSEAGGGPDWARRFAPGAALSADLDIDPFVQAGGYIRVELAPVGCAGCAAAWNGPGPAQARIRADRLTQSGATFFFMDESDQILLGRDYIPTDITFHLTAIEDIRYSRKVVMLTRGTRGDVQPFVVLARALADQHGHHVTICTEAQFQAFVEDRGGRVGRGRVDFVLSGGSTAARLAMPLVQSMIGLESAEAQALCVALFEAPSFDSEPAMLALVRRLRPDSIVYNQIATSVAAAISESQSVPAIGLFLQLQVVPSRFYGPVVGLPARPDTDSVTFDLVRALRRLLTSGVVDRIRRRRGLLLHRSDPYDVVLAQGEAAPILVPMDPDAIGGRPADWPVQMVTSGFIWDPDPTVLSADLVAFLRPDPGLGPRLSISFSSMPIDAAALQRIVLAIAAQSVTHPRLVVIGADPIVTHHDAVRALIRHGRVLHVPAAPFSALFRHVDAAIVHGGLGTSSELLRAGIPALVTGPLLMDQRFWADRIHRLGFGPPMMPWAEFAADPAGAVDALFGRYDRYRAQAAPLSRRLQAEDGVGETVRAVIAAMETARPMRSVRCGKPAQVVLDAWVRYGARLGAALVNAGPLMAQAAWCQAFGGLNR